MVAARLDTQPRSLDGGGRAGHPGPCADVLAEERPDLIRDVLTVERLLSRLGVFAARHSIRTVRRTGFCRAALKRATGCVDTTGRAARMAT
jgi:hypothetical protein